MSSAYGIGVIALILGMGTVIIFYQSFYLPESLESPQVAYAILFPQNPTTQLEILYGADNRENPNFSPKKIEVVLGINNKVIWYNQDITGHTVSTQKEIIDSYSGKFGSDGIIRPGQSYEFLFTEPVEFDYHCIPHPWMSGTISVIEQRF